MNHTPSTPHLSVIIVGGGQAGISLSHYLKQRGIDHLVLEKHQAMHSWRTQRWDNFCLVTPNWQCKLPGHEYSGDDPHGFMKKDQINDYLSGFFKAVSPPIREGVTVQAAGKRLLANAERHLKPPAEMARLFRTCPEALAAAGVKP